MTSSGLVWIEESSDLLASPDVIADPDCHRGIQNVVNGYRRPVVFVALIVVVMTGCIGGPGTTGTIAVRNESTAVIGVQFDAPGYGPFGGTQHVVSGVPPLAPTYCTAWLYGVKPGEVSVTVWGSSIGAPQTRTMTIPDGQSFLYVLILTTGHVTFSSDNPGEKYPCDGWPNVSPPPRSN